MNTITSAVLAQAFTHAKRLLSLKHVTKVTIDYSTNKKKIKISGQLIVIISCSHTICTCTVWGIVCHIGCPLEYIMKMLYCTMWKQLQTTSLNLRHQKQYLFHSAMTLLISTALHWLGGDGRLFQTFGKNSFVFPSYLSMHCGLLPKQRLINLLRCGNVHSLPGAWGNRFFLPRLWHKWGLTVLTHPSSVTNMEHQEWQSLCNHSQRSFKWD